MTYPVNSAQRVQFWSNRIDYRIRQLKPLFEASEILVKQFYNEETTGREATAGDLGQEEHVRRTKSNIVYGYIDQSLSNMLDRAPTLQCYPADKRAASRVNPMSPNSLSQSDGVAKIANYRYRETNQLRVDERVSLNAFLFPYGVAKIGYTMDLTKAEQELLQPETPAELEFENPEEENLFLAIGQPTRVAEAQDHVFHIQMHTALLQGGLLLLSNGQRMSPEQEEIVEQTILDHIKLHKRLLDRKDPDANTNVRWESPFAIAWPSDLFLTDGLSMEGPQDARWVAFGGESPIEEILGDARFENTKGLEPIRYKDAPQKAESDEADGFDMVRWWEVWAKNFPIGRGKFRDVVMTIAEGHDKFLRYDEEWPYDRIDDYPCETLSFTPGLRTWFAKPTVLLGGGDTVQSLVNEVLDANLSIIRKQKNIWLVDPNSGITQSLLQQIMDAPDGAVVPVPGLMEMKGQAIVPLPFLEIPPEKGEMLGMLQSMFDRALGTPQPLRAARSDSATEASIIEKRNTSRENRKASLLAEFQVRKARKMWQLDAQYQPPQLFLIEPETAQFLQISKEMAEGEYLFSMDITSHSTAMATEKAQAMDLLNIFAGLTPVFVQQWGLPPNLPELARRVLVRGFDEKMVEEILGPLLTAATAKMQQGLQQPGIPGEVQDPNSLAAVQDGRTFDQGIGALQPESFNRDVPNEGKQSGGVLRG